MSYILDALRRADAERQRGQIPGLHAQPGPASTPLPARRLPAWAWLLMPALALVLGLAWWQGSRPAAPGTPDGVAVGAAVGPNEWPTAAPTPHARLPETVAPAPATAPPAPAPPAMPLVVTAPSPPPAPSPMPVPMPSPMPAPAAAGAPAPPPGPAPVAEPRTLRLTELPPEQRRGLPPLVLGGSVWSDSAASRFVMLDGQVLREGDTAAPGLVLERIGPKAAWLRWRELRLELPL